MFDRRSALTAAPRPAAPRISTATRGSHVGSAVGANAAFGDAEVPGDEPATRETDHLQDEIDRIDDEADRHRRDRHGDDGDGEHDRREQELERRTPSVQLSDTRALPEALVAPQMLCAVHRTEQGADGADAAAGGDVELDAGFMKRAEHAGVIGARRPGAGQ